MSFLQHSYVFVLMATFSPTECLIAPVSYLLRAAPDGMEPHADFGLLRHWGRGETVVLQSPRSRYLTPSATGPGRPSKESLAPTSDEIGRRRGHYD